MEYRYNGKRYSNYYKWEDKKQDPYNYENQGLLQHILSNKIYNTENEYLIRILSYYESSLIFLMKYVDKLKNFKNYHWQNR